MEHNRVRHHGISASHSYDSLTMYGMASNWKIFRLKQSGTTETKAKYQQTPAEKLPNRILNRMKQMWWDLLLKVFAAKASTFKNKRSLSCNKQPIITVLRRGGEYLLQAPLLTSPEEECRFIFQPLPGTGLPAAAPPGLPFPEGGLNRWTLKDMGRAARCSRQASTSQQHGCKGKSSPTLLLCLQAREKQAARCGSWYGVFPGWIDGWIPPLGLTETLPFWWKVWARSHST